MVRITCAALMIATACLYFTNCEAADVQGDNQKCVRNLKEIALALVNHEAVNGTYPAAFSVDKEGRPLLSWRVHILPFLDQSALYQRFHLNEPWDSPHNKALIKFMPTMYACPGENRTLVREGKTSYLAPRGPATVFPGAEPVSNDQITDGPPNTALIVEASDSAAVIWTKPEDWNVGGEPKTRALFGRHTQGTNFLFADGSVNFLKESIKPEDLKAKFTRNGNEVLPADSESADEKTNVLKCVNVMKAIALGLEEYHTTHGTLPAAFSVDQKGQPLLSWRVHILPFLGHKPLYQRFHLDEPWDSPHNKALIKLMPAAYACPGENRKLVREGKTSYLAPRGPATVFPGAEPVSNDQITDGPPNTALIVEASDSAAVIWTKPEDWNVGGEPKARALFGRHPRGTHFLIADGSVHFIKDSIKPEDLKAKFTRNGNEVIEEVIRDAF